MHDSMWYYQRSRQVRHLTRATAIGASRWSASSAPPVALDAPALPFVVVVQRSRPIYKQPPFATLKLCSLLH